jgi:hypothetical protein
MTLPLETHDDTVIRRYTDLARFVMLLDERRLWFSKLKALHRGDPYEGYAVAEKTEDPVRLLMSRRSRYPRDKLFIRSQASTRLAGC